MRVILLSKDYPGKRKKFYKIRFAFQYFGDKFGEFINSFVEEIFF